MVSQTLKNRRRMPQQVFRNMTALLFSCDDNCSHPVSTAAAGTVRLHRARPSQRRARLLC